MFPCDFADIWLFAKELGLDGIISGESGVSDHPSRYIDETCETKWKKHIFDKIFLMIFQDDGIPNRYDANRWVPQFGFRKHLPLEDSFWIQATRADVSLDPSHVGPVLRCPVVPSMLDLGRRVLAWGSQAWNCGRDFARFSVKTCYPSTINPWFSDKMDVNNLLSFGSFLKYLAIFQPWFTVWEKE